MVFYIWVKWGKAWPCEFESRFPLRHFNPLLIFGPHKIDILQVAQHQFEACTGGRLSHHGCAFSSWPARLKSKPSLPNAALNIMPKGRLFWLQHRGNDIDGWPVWLNRAVSAINWFIFSPNSSSLASMMNPMGAGSRLKVTVSRWNQRFKYPAARLHFHGKSCFPKQSLPRRLS